MLPSRPPSTRPRSAGTEATTQRCRLPGPHKLPYAGRRTRCDTTGARTGRVRAGELEVRPAFACARRSAMVLRRPREREVYADVAEGQVTVDEDGDGLLRYVAQL